MKTLILGLLMLGASATALADDHGGGGEWVDEADMPCRRIACR